VLGFVDSDESKKQQAVPMSAQTHKVIEFDVSGPDFKTFKTAQHSANKDETFHLTSYLSAGPQSEHLRSVPIQAD